LFIEETTPGLSAANLSKRNVRPLLPKREVLSKEVGWPLERGALRFLWLLLLLCPFWWLIDNLEPDFSRSRGKEGNAARAAREAEEMKWEWLRATWVVGWVLLLISMWLINPAPAAWRWFFAALAIVRLLEIATTGLGTILGQRQQVRARNLITIVLYAVQLTFIFAILDHSFVANDFVSEPSANVATRASDYLYISWSDMVTLGSDYAPQSGGARLLTVLTTSSSIFLFSVLLAFGIDTISQGEGRPRR
jgi:hypothetical protein